MLKSFHLISKKIEPYAHDISMKGLKASAGVLNLIWPKVFEGEEPSLDLCSHIIYKGHKSIFFVTSKTPVRTGLIQPMVDALEAAGITVTVYDAVKPDPTFEDIEAAVTVLKSQHCDAVLALGGGSVIDAAKTISARAKNKKSIAKMTGMMRVTRGMLPLYAVPTTAGTGSEVTIAAVVTDSQNQRKLAIVDPRLMPKAVALDGKLMVGVPKGTTAATGMDALTHAVEGFISLNATSGTDKLALEATRLIMENLATVVADGSNLAGRQAMARASHLAGKAFTQSGVGYVHAIAHNFGALYHVPHGRANAIIMPYVLDYSLQNCAERLALLAEECEIGNDDMSAIERARSFIQHIRDMNNEFEIPQQLDVLKAADIPRIAKAARDEARFTYAVPRHMSQKNCEQVVEQMLIA